MVKKLWTMSVAVVMLVVVLCVGVLFGGMYRHNTAQAMGEYRRQAEHFVKLIEGNGQDLLPLLSDVSDLRIQWISQKGATLFDSAIGAPLPPDLLQLPDVDAAKRDGWGEMENAGTTLTEVTGSVTLRLTDGAYLRVSGVRDSFLALIMDRLWQLLLIVLGASITTLWLSQRFAQWVAKPLDAIDLEHLENRTVCQELQPALKRIAAMNRQRQKQLQVQMNELKREYEKQDRMRRDFTANVSHELKTPLTSISGYAELLRAGIVRGEDQDRFAGKIYEETQRLITLVGDILKLSQLDDGYQVRMERVDIDLYAACQRVIARLQAAADHREVTFYLEGGPLIMQGAEQVVDEIIYNLCDNAIKYNQVGGTVTVSVYPKEDRAVLLVKDTGIGIPQGEDDRVFERFYRVDKSHSKEIGGTGLGLSIVKHGAAYHNAKIELNSHLGEGTEIRVLFPRQEEPDREEDTL